VTLKVKAFKFFSPVTVQVKAPVVVQIFPSGDDVTV
jgi:hypothetical protein